MAGITLAQAQAQLDAWLAASLATTSGQSYTIAGRSLSRVNAGEINRNIDAWNARVITLSNKADGRSRARTVVAC